ncbi:MAG: hypothetical protein QM784_33505 [Polyangiaceae bacterium]
MGVGAFAGEIVGLGATASAAAGGAASGALGTPFATGSWQLSKGWSAALEENTSGQAAGEAGYEALHGVGTSSEAAGEAGGQSAYAASHSVDQFGAIAAGKGARTAAADASFDALYRRGTLFFDCSYRGVCVAQETLVLRSTAFVIAIPELPKLLPLLCSNPTTAAALVLSAGSMVPGDTPVLNQASDASSSAISDSGESGKGAQEKGRPTNNRDHNGQAKDAIREYERQTGRRLVSGEIRQAHNEFGRGSDPNYHDLVEILKDLFGAGR